MSSCIGGSLGGDVDIGAAGLEHFGALLALACRFLIVTDAISSGPESAKVNATDLGYEGAHFGAKKNQKKDGGGNNPSSSPPFEALTK